MNHQDSVDLDGRAQTPATMAGASRRAVLAGAGAAAVVALAGCTTYGPGGARGGGGTPPGGNPAGATLAKTGDIPVGGGVVLSASQVVITQPEAGQFKAFTAICTHQGCTVASVSDGTINCPCHGSKFKAADGSIVNGPASLPLRSVDITVEGTDIKLA